MTKKNWLAVGIIGGILLLLAVISYFYMTQRKIVQKRVNISVVVYGSTAERWVAFKQGVDQAASDFGGIVNFVVLTESGSSREQMEQIDRELENGAQGIAAAVTDSSGMAEYIGSISNRVPVVLAENKVEGSQAVTCVEANAYEMGQALAHQAAEGTAKEVPVSIVLMGENKSSLKERLDGFRAGCADEGRKIEQNFYPSRDSMSRILESGKENILVALDDLSLEMTEKVIRDSEADIRLYGIGSSEQIVYALDQGYIEGIVFQNEYNMGYEVTDTLIQKIRKGVADEAMEIDFHQATGATLHNPENERLLYPIIQ